MAEQNEKNLDLSVEEVPVEKKAEKKSSKNAAKGENFFVRTWKKLLKFFKDTAGELKKVYWTPKDELIKNTKLVVVTVVAVGLAIGIVDTVCSFIVNTIAGLIG